MQEMGDWRTRLEALMGEPRIYADPMKEFEKGCLSLVCQGTFNDLARYSLELNEGMRIKFWTDDADDKGNRDPLLFEGTVHFDVDQDCWVAELDSRGYWHLSDTQK
jgi:hypothetical protein